MGQVLQHMRSLALGIQDEQNRQLRQLDLLSDSVDKANERIRTDSRKISKLTWLEHLLNSLQFLLNARSTITLQVINLWQSGLVIVMDVNTSVGKKREIRDEGNKGQAKKAKTKQCFVGGFCFRCTFPFRKTTSVFYTQFKRQTILFWKAAYPVGKTLVGNYIAKCQK